MPPARSNRQYYKIPEITVTRNVSGTPTDEPIIVFMKKSHADLLSLEPIEADDPIWDGEFGGTGDNAGKAYLRRLGGYKQLSYTLVAEDKFTLTVNTADGQDTEEVEFKSIGIGFPRGVSAIEFKNWIQANDAADQIAAFVTPDGRRFPLVTAAA